MSKWSSITKVALAVSLAFASAISAAYNSGSTGADGAFNPSLSQSVQIPPSGIFNYTSVNIPAGVTITYTKNAANTPVTILASGNVTIAGIIDVGATIIAGDIGIPGVGGPGAYDGGRGGPVSGDASFWVNGLTGPNVGRAGVGPGGGTPGKVVKPSSIYGIAISAGGGGAFGTAPAAASGECVPTPGLTYGNLSLQPLIGGSGGGGGDGGSALSGSGGGGGGGAILIASSGTISVTGSILANGGIPVSSTVNGRGSQGGGGSGGAIRLVATTISGNGTISAVGGSYPGEQFQNTVGTAYYVCSNQAGGKQNGGAGRIRLEAEVNSRTAATSPAYGSDVPGLLFIPGGTPTLNIVSVAGVAVPANPTGLADIILQTATNPVTVAFATKGVTVGSTITLTLMPPIGAGTTATSAATTGTVDNATAAVSIDLPGGNSILQASVTFTVVASLGDAMSKYAQGERVEKVRLISTLNGPSTATLITVSGKEFTVPAEVLAGIQG